MERRCAEDVFSAERWLASAPLHEAGKTTGSGDTLKPGVRREELGCASDNLSSDPNAYPLIPTFSKPHSEVASTTHLPALKRFRKGASLVFWFSSRRKVPQQMQRLKNAAKGGLLRQKIPLPQPAEIYTQRGAAAQSPAPNRTANPLPEVHWISRWKKIPVSPLKLPSHPPFEILHLTAGTFRSAAGESSALKLSLAVSHSFYVFPGLRNRNQSHIPARRENLLHQINGFRTFLRSAGSSRKYRFISSRPVPVFRAEHGSYLSD